MANILIVAPYSSIDGEQDAGRFQLLAEALSMENSVTFVTSIFSHTHKKIRLVNKNLKINYELILLREPGYVKNNSIARIFSHLLWVRNFNLWFIKNNSKFDLVYSAYPLISHNKVIARYKKDSKYKYIVDIQDIWPRSFSVYFPIINYIGNKFLPFYSKIKNIFRSADLIVAVSNTYIEFAKDYLQDDSKKYLTVYLGSNIRKYDCHRTRSDNKCVNLFYIGTLSKNYSIDFIIKTIILFNRRSPKKIKFHIYGDGPEYKNLLKYKSDSIKIYGRLPYADLIQRVYQHDIAVNPISKNGSQSITNKLSDYLMMGCPILSCQKNKEVIDLLIENHGIFYDDQVEQSLLLALNKIINDNYNLLDWKSVDIFDKSKSTLSLKSTVYSILK